VKSIRGKIDTLRGSIYRHLTNCAPLSNNYYLEINNIIGLYVMMWNDDDDDDGNDGICGSIYQRKV